MTGLVHDLQKDALDSNVGLPELLRKAMVVSRKLKINSMERWINLELDGYDRATIEDWQNVIYREVRGRLTFYNPYMGYVPAVIENTSLLDKIEIVQITQSIPEIHDLLRKDKSNELKRQYSATHASILREMFKVEFQPWLIISRQNLMQVLEAGRKKILDWSLDLESQGVLGEGMTFTKQEQQAASQIHYNTVNNIGTMTNSQLQQNSSGTQSLVNKDGVAEVRKIVEAVESVIFQLKLASDCESELKAEIETIKSQLTSPKPKQAVIKECLISAKTILEGAAGNILASGIASQIPGVIAVLGSS